MQRAVASIYPLAIVLPDLTHLLLPEIEGCRTVLHAWHTSVSGRSVWGLDQEGLQKEYGFQPQLIFNLPLQESLGAFLLAAPML